MKRCTTSLVILLPMMLWLTTASAQVLEHFSYSSCREECIGDSTTIDRFHHANDLTEIIFTGYANCVGSFEGDILATDDTLNLIHQIKPIIEINKKTGRAEELLEVAMCDCIFTFNYRIRGLKDPDRNAIKINGETLERINQRESLYEPMELQIEIDSTFSSDEIYTVTDQSAQFPGGMSKLWQYIEDHLIYPNDARAKGIEGKVFVQFVINKDGSIDDNSIEVVKGLNKSCNAEALRLMKQCPDWSPATIKGQPVKYKLILPVQFVL